MLPLEMKGKMEVFHSIKKLLLIIESILGQKCKITNDFSDRQSVLASVTTDCLISKC